MSQSSHSSIKQLLQKLSGMNPELPGPSLLNRVNDLRRSQVSLDHRLNKTLESIRENSKQVDDLKSALEVRLKTIEQLKQEHEKFVATSAADEAEINAIAKRIQATAVPSGKFRLIIVLIIGLLTGYGIALLKNNTLHNLTGVAQNRTDEKQSDIIKQQPSQATTAVLVPDVKVEENPSMTVSETQENKVASETMLNPPIEKSSINPLEKDSDMMPEVSEEVVQNDNTDSINNVSQIPAHDAPDQNESAVQIAPDEIRPVENTVISEIKTENLVVPDVEQKIIQSGPLYRVRAGSLRVRNEASGESDVVAVVTAGMLVPVLEETEGWSHITTPDGKSGWVASRYLLIQVDE